MRNLKIIRRKVLQHPDRLQLTVSTWDVATNSVLCVFGPTRHDPSIQLKRWKCADVSGNNELLLDIASWDAPCPLPDLECDRVLDLHYFPDSLTAYLVLAGGDIIVVREKPQNGEEKIEILGSVDGGIFAAAWSPDEELFAIATRANTLLYMTREFDNVADIALTSEDLKASKHVSVGWGKTETQFKGKRAKVLRDPTMPEHVDEGKLSRYDTRSSTISWRGDGAFLAINSIVGGARRVIRVFSREGTLDSVSEPVDGLEGALSWRPSGNILAGVQRLENCARVVFFERNGLRHGQFELRLSREELDDWGASITLNWNIESSVLAVGFKDRVQLWTMGNYHYYLKQEIPGHAVPDNREGASAMSDDQETVSTVSDNQEAVSTVWHPEQALRFISGFRGDARTLHWLESASREIYIRDGLQVLECSFDLMVDSISPPNDFGLVAVIDGKTLKLSPLRIANIPPPMAFEEIVLPSNVVDVAMFTGPIKHGPASIAILSTDSISVYRWSLGQNLVGRPLLVASCPTLDVRLEASGMCHQVTLLEKFNLLVVESNSSGSFVRCLNLESLSILFDIEIGRPFVRMLCPKYYSSSGMIPPAYLLEEGTVLKKDPCTDDNAAERIEEYETFTKFPKPVSRVEIVELECYNSSTPTKSPGDLKESRLTTIAFGLSSDGLLFANGVLLAKSCTSFLVTSMYLVVTTTQHLLKFAHLARVEELEIPPDAPETDERCRSIERGAKLVTVMPSTFSLVLQMPRGNLETIYPRVLVLSGIRESLRQRKYDKAFLACRNHRVDMNILHDHDPLRFMANVSLFIDSVKKAEHIDLFLSQLRDEDVSKTMYVETLGAEQYGTTALPRKGKAFDVSIGEGSKVNRICDAFLNILRDRPSLHIQNIISAHACKFPPDLDSGLSEIARLKNDHPEQAEKAVEHICFLADVNKLFDHALGLYDLDLALLVAQQSQKDPREYLPFLQNLQSLPLLRMKFTVDDHLKRYNKALRHLHDLKEFQTFKSYTTKHDLYKESLGLYRYQEDNIRELMRLYADYLQLASKYREAGVAYEYVKDYTSASESYRLAHFWRESLSCAALIPLDPSQLQSLARALADTLVESKDYNSAAAIHRDHLSNLELSARLLCQGHFFADAIHMLCLHQRVDLLEPVIDAGLIESMAAMTELLAECKAQLNAQLPRLRELRIKKAEEPLAFYDGDVNGGVDIPDNVSLAPTDSSTAGGSLFTRYTNRTGTVGTNATRRTSKSRRREERKRARGKKGSVYEEEYLVNSIGRLIDRVNAVGDDVARLVTGLMRRAMRERARAVDTAMVELVQMCKECVGEVFQGSGSEEVAVKPDGRDQEDHPVRPKGADGVLWISVEESQERRERPLVKDFERLALFDS